MENAIKVKQVTVIRYRHWQAITNAIQLYCRNTDLSWPVAYALGKVQSIFRYEYQPEINTVAKAIAEFGSGDHSEAVNHLLGNWEESAAKRADGPARQELMALYTGLLGSEFASEDELPF